MRALSIHHCKHIFLTRRNKVRQAVSWWKAIQSGQWHAERGVHSVVLGDDAYSFDAINHLFAEATMREAGIQDFLAAAKIPPLMIAYEDMVLDFNGTIRSMISYMEITPGEPYSIDDPFYERLADTVSESWVQRFREERQAGWDNKGW